MLAVPFEFWDRDIHEHCSDEVTHTIMIQNAGRDLRRELDDDDYKKLRDVSEFFFHETGKYLEKLSRRVFRQTVKMNRENGDFSIASYAMMAFLIERRILKIYPAIAKFGPTESMRDLAFTIFKDEKKHLNFVGERLPAGLSLADINKQELIDLEEDLAIEWQEVLFSYYESV
jgi:hypothetical protein